MSKPRFLTMLVALLGLAATGYAAFSRADGPNLFVNEARVITLRATVAHNTPVQRAALAAKRLANTYPVQEITSRLNGHGLILLAGPRVILQVDPLDAAAEGTTVEDLAGTWKQSINDALSLPPVAFGSPSITIGIGRIGKVELMGAKSPWAAFATANPDIASYERTKTGLAIHGKAVGSTTITAQDGTQLTVNVMEVAAQFPQTLTAEVVGSPTTGASVQEAIRQSLLRRLRTAQGASVEIQSDIPSQSVPLGSSSESIIHVKTTAPEALDAEGNVVVTVRNIGIERISEAELWYCNDPERVTKPQDLFHGQLLVERPVRLLYHHIDDSSENLLLRAQLLNRTDRTARVAVIPGWAKPDGNPVLAGLNAAEGFLKDWLIGSGRVVVVPPHSKVALASCPMPAGMTASGLYYLRLLPGGASSLGVDVKALTPEEPASTQPIPQWQEATPSPTAEVYPHPFCDDEVSYKVGGPYGFYRLGGKALTSPTSKTPLYGNFGVVYKVNAHAENPTNLPADVEVSFESSAGYSGALFLIDGVFRRINPLQPKEEVQLARFRLQPGESRDVKLVTLPLSGSAYPALIVVRSIDRS